MDWMSILGVGASVASGGVFGLIGSAFGAWMKTKERKEQAISQEKEREHERKMFELQMQSTSQDGAWTGLETSLRAAASINGQENYKWVIAIKSLFRPFITLFLWVAVGFEIVMVMDGQLGVYIASATANTALFSAVEIQELVKYIVYSTVFSATTATTWWFGERALSLPNVKNR